MPLLAGCGVVGLLGEPPDLRSPAGPLEVGACLEGMVGNDSDRESVVSCDAPHRFEVVAIAEWPEMNEFIRENGDLSFSRLHPASDTDAQDVLDYFDWATDECQQAIMESAGIADVEVDGHSAVDLGLRLGGGYGLDISLASRTGFQAGDHRTVCSAAWYNSYGAPSLVEFPVGVRFADVNTTSLPIEQRECWAVDYDIVPCDEEHAGQVVVDFDGLEAFGPEVITRAAEGEPTEADWTLEDAFCDELTDAAMARPEFMSGLAYFADLQSDYGWGAWDGEVDDDYTYRYACLVAAPGTTDLLTGDVFAGDVQIVADSSEGA
jgi:hypothetical protein